MDQERFVPGQRWISDTEPTLGLGTLLRRDGRQLQLAFRASAEQRIYALDNAPLTRVRFLPGDKLTHRNGEPLRVSALREEQGLIHYRALREDGSVVELSERELDDALQFNRPQQRLFNGQLDNPNWFDLRQQTLAHRQRLESSPLRGLGGGRTSLLAHQLYIAHEVGGRALPRVLLADEVGLGKTIEACMILHQQLLTGRAQRALILVPPALLNQWLVELLRRFNLRASLFDEERYQAIESANPGANPFHSEQLILCTTELLLESAERGELVRQAGWDLLIVDEAHHLEWHIDKVSAAYQLVESLASETSGVLLLTATPEQLGSSGHFARLRLLDADRFPDLEHFRQEQGGYRSIAKLASALQTQSTLKEPLRAELIATLGAKETLPLLQSHAAADLTKRTEISHTLTQRLLDRHGTGRVLFRNTRQGIKGFPRRQRHSYPLPMPECYRSRRSEANLPVALQLTPEMLMLRSEKPWWRSDPRIDWLLGLLRKLKHEKVLLICAYSRTARAIEEALRSRQGIAAALFHEQMTIVERDRAAAWFADTDAGAQLLICSEIGSEGRNFQFAHHLVLFDLPLDPDLLEQRIGRLDRIGQSQTIEIHLPYFEASAQAVMFEWYDRGLDAFRHTSAAAHLLFSQQHDKLEQCLKTADEQADATRVLIAATAELRGQAETRMREGRDLLLELNSCRQPDADRLRQQLAQSDQDGRLPGFAQRLLESLGVDCEEHSADTLILKPGNEMFETQLPGLPEQGITGTFRRELALSREEWQFLTWEHPLISGTMELLIDRGLGNSSCCAVHHPNLKAGSLLLELLYLVECPAPRALRIGRFLPPTMIRLLIDGTPRERGEISRAELAAHRVPLETAAAKKLSRTLRTPAQAQIEFSEPLAEARMRQILTNGRERLQRHYGEELSRLHALRKVNPGVTREEILAWERQAEASELHLQATHLRLDAVQLVIAL
ncbi:MAG: RNA polymerase-associated protein RapA [Gammaproteobacteria bacterium]|nr:RNA polymerase-associated protein RapA [Gammaproteobacteria bacterium]